MNTIVSQNLKQFLAIQSRKTSWILHRTGLDLKTFEDLLEGKEEALPYLKKIADLFNWEVSEFYEPHMTMPFSLQEIQQKRNEKSEQKEPFVYVTDKISHQIDNIQNNLLNALFLVQGTNHSLNEKRLDSVFSKLNELEKDVILLLEEALEKEASQY